MKPLSKEKLSARKKYWGFVVSIQNELISQAQRGKLDLLEIRDNTRLAESTVMRFFGVASGKRKAKPYSWSHGPYTTTVLAIADAVGFDVVLQRRK